MLFGHCSLEAGQRVSQEGRIDGVTKAHLNAMLFIRDAVGCYWRVMALKIISAIGFDAGA